MESTSTSPVPPESDNQSNPNDTPATQPAGTPAPNVIEPTTPAPAESEPSTSLTPSVIEPSTPANAPTVSPFEQPNPTTTPPAATTEPDVTPEMSTVQPETPTPGTRKLSRKTLLLAGVGVLLLVATGASSYLLGKHAAKPATMATTAQQTVMAVPKDATVIEQCTPGFGTQYVLPKDIPGGPVYNVYQGKLIGIEYMTALTSASNPDLMLKDLPLFTQKYDHVDIMTMPAHAGFPSPHYQVDVMMVPTSVSSKITCDSAKTNSSNSSDMSSMNNTTNSSMDSSMSSSNKTSM